MSRSGTEPSEQKAELRGSAARQRKGLARGEADADRRLARHAGEIAGLAAGAVVAGYLPIRSEISPLGLVGELVRLGLATAMPVTPKPGNPLSFRLWAPGDALDEGPYGTSQPCPAAGPAQPGLLLVPLLAFDAECYRLGYGGGFYDRTIGAARAAGRRLAAIGIAFDGQLVDAVPRGPFDEPLDGVLTPSGMRLPHGPSA